MASSYSLLYLFSILICLVAGAVALEAIVGANKVTTQHKFQYHVAISINALPPRCSGGIIGHYYIISAASCMIRTGGQLYGTQINVIAGTINLDVSGIVIGVEKVLTPKTYQHRVTGVSANDIAILKLYHSLDLVKNTHLKSLYLPTSNYNHVYNRTAIITGYGWQWVQVNENHMQIGGNYDNTLRFAEAQILSRERCDYDHPTQNFNDSVICARVKQSDNNPISGACVGDGGGPLVVRDTIVVGIFILSKIGCAESESSGVYTYVGHHRNFIQNVLSDKETVFMNVYNTHIH